MVGGGVCGVVVGCVVCVDGWVVVVVVVVRAGVPVGDLIAAWLDCWMCVRDDIVRVDWWSSERLDA